MAVPFASLSFLLVCLVIILGVFNPAIADSESDLAVIPTGYTSYEDLMVAYKVHTERLPWAEARQACINEGGHLAIIDTMEKVRHVADLKRSWDYIWIGISRPNSASVWTTAGSHSLMPNLPWAPGKPAGSHNCLAVRGCNRGLTNENCSNRLRFVCEMTLMAPSHPDYGSIIIY